MSTVLCDRPSTQTVRRVAKWLPGATMNRTLRIRLILNGLHGGHDLGRDAPAEAGLIRSYRFRLRLTE